MLVRTHHTQTLTSSLEISKIDTNLENTRQRMEEAYELDYEGCLPMRKEDFNLEDSMNMITVLKRKITMLGAVNPNAVEEYAYEKEHCEEMVSQRDDLQTAIDDLQTALNAGVEILACPPGKKLTKISLLSGGERALTAIAILFAILKSHPMPFCILDEIEAALDEANVDRFASYLKRFSQETQFIVITHRKPTMNQADSLFGVTMQEKGVSKIVSVKLSEVEHKLGNGTVE